MAPASASNAWIAAHRFGLGEPDLAPLNADPARWLIQQIGAAEPAVGSKLASLADGLNAQAMFQQAQRAVDARPAGITADAEPLRDILRADLRSTLATAIQSQRPFAERLTLFWINHFTVSSTKTAVRGLHGAFEREAIRPHIGGQFIDLLRATTTHAAMLRYLDNERSMGPQSPTALARSARQRRAASRQLNADERMAPPPGLNENLARELLELHTLGVASKAYTQADVTTLAAVLTGWRVLYRAGQVAALPAGSTLAGFDPDWHEPGRKRLLGIEVPEGAAGLERVLEHLAQHPATARFIATKLARHFVADEPAPAMIDRLSERYLSSQGNLSAVYRALIESPEAWDPQPRKLKTPLEYVVSAHRLMGLATDILQRQPDAGVAALGQRLHNAPSPAGWPDRQDDWLGPEAVWRRVEWAHRVAERVGRQMDARALARRALGPGLSPATAQQIDRAADGPQALALLLLAPEFQRR